MDNNILYIGLKGYAGSGKDTIAKMLKIILENNDTLTKDECYDIFLKDNNSSATLRYINKNDLNNDKVYCIAYADQLKVICGDLTGIPLTKFYTNKSSGYININGDFKYTETKPPQSNIVTAEEYNNYSNFNFDAWMSLREFLVYIGTYVLQFSVNKNVFVNYIKNKINDLKVVNKNLKYVIVTDNRFYHEVDFIKNQNGIFISIERDNINKLSNIAEHDLDDLDDEDYFSDIEHYYIYNNGTYKELFDSLWNLVSTQISFKNIIYNLPTFDNLSIYIKLVEDNDKISIYTLNYDKTKTGINYVSHNNGTINEIQIAGCMLPIKIEEKIPGTDIICSNIVYNDEKNKYLIFVKK